MTPKLKRVIRLDSLPLGQTMFTHEGYLMDRPILTSIGIFEYHNPDGSVRRELRLPEEVFAKESLESYKGKPIIVTHDAGLIDKNNVHEESIGTILSDGYQDGDDVRAEIVIHDTDEMRECRLKELSLGYNLDLDETPGVWNGEPYDAIQRDIRINHLALVREARAGEQARLNIDGRDENMLKGGKSIMSKKTKKTTKKAARRDGILSPEELAAAIEQYKARRAERMAAAADDEDTEAKGAEAAVDEGEDDTVVATSGQEPETVEEQVQLVKDRRDRRDEAGDPETTEEAQGVIANQDEDIDTLLDIIDTLLAKEAFDEAEEESTEAEAETETAADEGEDEETGSEENTDGDDEESACDEGDEEAVNEDEGDDEGEEETAEDEDDEETSEDEDDEPAEEVAEDDDEEEEAPAAETGTMNADSVDAIIRTRIQLGMMGRTLNLDGLENMSILKAKKKIIKAVRPGIRLDGRGKTFIDAAYALACDEVKKLSKKDTAFQKKQMFNKKATRADSRTTRSGAESARERMIKRMNKEGK